MAATSFAPNSLSCAAARGFVADRLRAWGAEKVIEDAVLLTSELVTNVIRHAHTNIAMAVSVIEGQVRVAVGDDSVEPPTQHEELSPSDPGGRGLWLVDAISTSWGAEAAEDGKAVWFALAA